MRGCTVHTLMHPFDADTAFLLNDFYPFQHHMF
jgi:hypothetical protein